MHQIRPLVLALGIAALLAGCAGESSIKPSETLDEQTGMTVGSLEKPIELIQAPELPPSGPDHRISFAYLGPIEWDNMGKLTYALWIHVAPGSDWRFEDIQDPGSLELALDHGTSTLTVMHPPSLAHSPYRPIASWGQTAYVGVDLGMLRSMAASGRIELEVKAVGGAMVHFAAAPDARETLTRYLHARGY